MSELTCFFPPLYNLYVTCTMIWNRFLPLECSCISRLESLATNVCLLYFGAEERGSSVSRVPTFSPGGNRFDPRSVCLSATGWVGVSLRWPAETEVIVSSPCSCVAASKIARRQYCSLPLDSLAVRYGCQESKLSFTFRWNVNMFVEFLLILLLLSSGGMSLCLWKVCPAAPWLIRRNWAEQSHDVTSTVSQRVQVKSDVPEIRRDCQKGILEILDDYNANYDFSICLKESTLT